MMPFLAKVFSLQVQGQGSHMAVLRLPDQFPTFVAGSEGRIALPVEASSSRSAHSHSIVAGGLPVMSYTTRDTPGTSLTMRREQTSSSS